MENPDTHRDKEEQSTEERAQLLHLPYLDTRSIQKQTDFKGLFSVEEMRRDRVVVLAQVPGQMQIGITINTPQPLLAQLRNRFSDYKVSYTMISEAGLEEYLTVYDPPEEVHYNDIKITPSGENESLEEISQALETVKADDMLAYIIRQANQLKASDIHVENEEEYVRIRFRIDGVLHPIARLSQVKYRQLQSSIAIAANITANAHETQTGHLAHTLDDGTRLNMRIETIPTSNGQDAVIRLFTLSDELLELERLGMNQVQQDVIKQILDHPSGLILSVGPTGSGKTTTLYTMLKRLNGPERKIITLEDPVEYGFEGVTQIPVNSIKGDSFAKKLRAVLRQDPDIILVGEIRDVDTARTALQAALTGHMVLSTFHANDAPAALTRMLDIIGENPLLASAIRLIIAQRLVRRLDDATKQPYTPDEALKARLRSVIENLPEGVGRPNVDEIQFYKPGASEENPFGYVGQLAVVEQLVMSHELEQELRKPAREITVEHIRELTYGRGMMTMLHDGILKAAQGVTSLEEVYRVVS